MLICPEFSCGSNASRMAVRVGFVGLFVSVKFNNGIGVMSEVI